MTKPLMEIECWYLEVGAGRVGGMGQLERWSRCSCTNVALSTKPGFRFQGVKQGEWGMGEGGLVLSSGKKLFSEVFLFLILFQTF